MSFKVEAPRCSRCDDRVYFNEQYKVLGMTMHKHCFRCTSCDKRMELGKHLEHEGQPYCQNCHSKNFGPRGYGFGGGAGIMSGNFDGTTPTQAPAVPKSAKADQAKRRSARAESASSSSSSSSSKRRSNRQVVMPVRVEQPILEEPEFEEPAEYEPESEDEYEPPARVRKEKRRTSKRNSKRRSRREQEAAEEELGFMERLRVMCGCGRSTVVA